MNSARVVLVPLYHLEDPWDLPVLTVLVASSKTGLQPFPDMGVAVTLLQELARWELPVQVVSGVLRGDSDYLDTLF